MKHERIPVTEYDHYFTLSELECQRLVGELYNWIGIDAEDRLGKDDVLFSLLNLLGQRNM